MAGTDMPTTQPQPAEGDRDDKPEADKGSGQGVSSEQPAEGSDDTPGRQPGSPAG